MAFVKGLAGGFDGTVHIGAVGFCDLHQNRAGSRIIDGKGLARGRFDQLAVDEQTAWLVQKLLGWLAQSPVESDGIHAFLLVIGCYLVPVR